MQPTPASTGLWAAFESSNLAGQCIVVVLIALSLLAWTIMVFKFLELNFFKKQNKKTQAEFEHALKLGRWPALQGHEGSYATLLKAMLFLQKEAPASQADRIRELENTLEIALGKQNLRYEAQLSLLSTLTTAAPLLGLLGTVWGVMEAFGSVAHEEHVTLQSLAPGVSGALLTTVAGLLVALPCLFGFNTLVAKVKTLSVELEGFASQLHTVFASDPEGAAVPATPSWAGELPTARVSTP